jgi:urease accessory protein
MPEQSTMMMKERCMSTVVSKKMALGGALIMASSPVWAHHPMGGMMPETFWQGFLSGVGHPMIGVDHFAFLVIAALLAVALKGPARFLAPLAFVAATLGGTVLHLGAANIPMVETLIALSVLGGGLLVLTRNYLGAALLGGVFAISGVLHGYAYGESIVGAESAPILAYLVGLSVIQYAVVVGGVLGMEKLAARSEKARGLVARMGSMAAALTGGVFLLQSLA